MPMCRRGPRRLRAALPDNPVSIIAMNRLLASALVFFVSVSSLWAQRGQVEFRTLCPVVVDGVRELVIPGTSARQVQEVRLFTGFSPVAEGRFHDWEARFYVEKDEKGREPERTIVAQGTLTRSRQQLFVFVPALDQEPGEGLTYAVHCLPDDEKSFPLGSVRVINAADVPVRVTVAGEEETEIEPGAVARMAHPREVNDYGMYPAVVEYQGKDGKWIAVQSTNWRATKLRRDVVVIVRDPVGGNVLVKSFSDMPPWLEE